MTQDQLLDALRGMQDQLADLHEDMREVKAILTRMEKTISEIEKAAKR
jgi:hypothetical protein